MPNPEEPVAAPDPTLQQRIDQLAAQIDGTVGEVNELVEEYTPVREVSPEELEERMRQLGLPPEAAGPAPRTPQTVAQAHEIQQAALASPIFADPLDNPTLEQMPDRPAPAAQAQQGEATPYDDMSLDYREFRVRQDHRFPNPEPGELVMTRAQLGRTRRPQITTKRFRVVSMGGEPARPMWWAAFGLGQIESKAEAVLFTYEEIMQLSTNMVDTFLYCPYDGGLAEAVTATPAEPAAPAEPKKEVKRRRCNWQTFLGSTMVNMISLAPKNNTFRAKIMAILKEPIPDEMVTAEQIKDWVEFTFPREPGEVPVIDGMKFEVQYSHVEIGTTDFRRNVTGNFRGQISRDKILEIARANASLDWDELVKKYRDEFERMAREHGVITYGEPQLGATGFDIAERTNFDSVMVTAIRSPIREILRNNLTRAEIDDLGI